MTQYAAEFRQRLWAARFGHRQKRSEPGTEFGQLRCCECTIDSSCRRSLRHDHSLMQVFLKTCHVDVELENLRGKGILPGKFLCALDSTLPRGNRHRPIIIHSVAPVQMTIAFLRT